MKPTQYLYQEFIKEQKEQKAQTTKLSGNIKPSTSQKQIADNNNQSTIFSLVNLNVKEGQNDKVLFPVSLLPQSSKIKPQVMVNKNTEIARSLKKLKPISNSITNSEEMFQTSKGKVVDQQLNGSKILVYLKQLNKMTDGQFKKTQTQLLFGQIESKIYQNNILCVLRIQKLKFFNDYNNKNHKNPSLFCWEVLYRKQSLLKTSPKDYEGAQNDLLDFVYTRNAYEIVEIILWKIKNNDEKYVGQFDLTYEDYFGAKEILDYQKRIISENWIEKEMFKTMKQTKSFIGNIQFQLIQLGNETIPLNKYSGIPGSPKTEEERLRHRIIDQAMSGQEYRWYIDENEKLIIQKIDQISQEIVAECTLEIVQTECGQLTIIYEQKYNDPETNGRSRPNSRQMRKQHFDATMALIYELDKNGQFTSIQSNLRALSRQGRLSRKNIEDALYQMGCTANQLLLTECVEFGDCLMDFLLVTDDLSGVLEAMQEIKLVGEDELNLETFSSNLFLNIGQHLRKNTNLKKMINFIQALEKKPEIALLIQNYSYASENVLCNYPPFLQNFDPKNYEHVMVIGKLNKMIEKFKIDSHFTRALKKAHVDAKKSIYFEIPCFPKNQDLEKKAESLQLQAIGQNIMHEIVRRQKWKKSHSIFEKYSEWFFVADSQGITPFSQILEKAPFDVLQSMFSSYSEQLNSIFEKFNPYQDIYEINVPLKRSNSQIEKSQKENNEIKQNNGRKSKAFQWIQEQKEYRKNFLHNLVQNQNLTANEFSEILKLLEPLINKSNNQNFSLVKVQKLRSGGFIPLVLYLETLRQKCKRKLDRVQRELGTSLFICQMLNPNLGDDETLQNQQNNSSNFVWDNNNQYIISSIISKLPESLFLQFDDMFKFIQWIPSLEQLKIIRYINLPLRLLTKHKQQQKLIFILQQMYNEAKQKTYNPNNLDSDDVIQILYYCQIMILMLLEIRNLKSQNLESIQNLIFNQLKELTQQFTEILVIPMPINITQSYYPLKYIYKGNPTTLLELVNSLQFNQIVLETLLTKFDRLDIKLLGKALQRTQDKEALKDLIKLLLIKDQNKENSENQDYDSKEFSMIINPKQILDEQESLYREKLNKKQVEKLLIILKAELVLPIVCNDQSKFSKNVHSLILNSFYTRKSVGVTQQQIINWIRSYDYKISSRWKQLYIDYFRLKMDLYSMHCLIDIEFKSTKRNYINQDKLQPYINAQGNSWTALLDTKRLNQALKDNIELIDMEEALRAVAINGQHDKLEILLPHIKDPQILRQTIVFVCIIANCQTQMRTLFRKFQERRYQYLSLEDLIYHTDNNDDDNNNSNDNENKKKPVKITQSNNNKQELKKALREMLDLDDNQGHQKYYDILQSQKVINFNTSIKLPQNKMPSQKVKQKVERIVFPQSLDQIRTPISIQTQLIEMNQNISEEFKAYLKQQQNSFGKLDLQKYEQQFEKDIVTFRHLKCWKSSLFRQNLTSLFTQGYQGSENFQYKKVLILLTNHFKRHKLPFCKQSEDYYVVIKMLIKYGIINIDEYMNEIVSSSLDITQKNALYFHFIMLLIQPSSDSQFIKNQNMFIEQIHQVVRKLNLLEEYNNETMANILKEIHKSIKKRVNHDILPPLEMFQFKLACEILISFEKLDIKNEFQDQILEIAQTIRNKKLNDKLLQQLANKYLNENDQKLKSQIVTFQDIIQSFKKKKLEDILQQTDLTYYITKFSDRNCEEIIKELFKLPYDKKYKRDLLSKFDRRLFECLIFYQRFITYNTLIHQILFKQILNGDVGTFTKIIKQPQDSAQIQQSEKKFISSNDNIQEENINQQDEEFQEFSIAQIAAQFNFYEYFDTLHRLNLKVKEITPQPSIRFTFETNDQLLIIASEFEKKELNYISNCLKMMRYLRINHYEIDAQQFNFENEIMICFIVENISLIKTPCLNIIKYYLQLNGNQYPLWQDTLIQRMPAMQKEEQYKSLFKKKILEQSLIRMKVNGVENGVKFCFPSDYQSEKDEYLISNEDIRKTQLKKVKFSIDQYIEHLDKNDRQKLENQLINDTDFQKILTNLQVSRKNQEFLIDKLNFIQVLQKMPQDHHEIYYYLINYPFFWYEEKIPKDQSKVYNFFLEFELGFVFFKAILMFEPKRLDQALQIYFYSLNDYAKTEEQKTQARNNKRNNGRHPYYGIRNSLSDHEYQEVEVTDEEAESQYRLQQDNQMMENGQTEVNQDQMVNNQQAQGQSRNKIKKKIMKFKLKDYKEPENGLRRQIQEKFSNQVQFFIFLQLLFLATTNEESFLLIQKYLLEYLILPPLQPPKEIDINVKNRLLENGYKLPYDHRFLEQIISNNSQLSQQQIEDIEHVKQIIRFNQNLKETQYSQVIQLLISQVFKSQYIAYQKLIDNLLQHPAFICLDKQKPTVYSSSLENDKQFQNEMVNYFQKIRQIKQKNNKYRQIQINQDFVQKFFEAKSNIKFTNDKWIHIICLIKFLQQLENQFTEFDQKEVQSRYLIITCIGEVGFGFNASIEEQVNTINPRYHFNFQVNTNFTSPTYEYTKKSDRIIYSTRYFFQLDISINISSCKNPNNPFPIPQIHSKTYDELEKIFKTFLLDLVKDVFLHLNEYHFGEMRSFDDFDRYEAPFILKKLTLENYEQVSFINQFYFYISEAVTQFRQSIISKSDLKNIIEQLENQPDGTENIDSYYKKSITNPRIKNSIKLIIQDKSYVLPMSNYQPRIQNNQQNNIDIDLTFPELYPITQFQIYNYLPDLISEEEYNQKYDSLSVLQSACAELELYAKELNEFLDQLPTNEQINESYRNPVRRNIYWPLLTKRIPPEQLQYHKFKYTYIIETIPLYLIHYLKENLIVESNQLIKFTLNCLSFCQFILTKLIRMIQQYTKKKCKISTSISLVKEWVWLQKILATLGSIIVENEFDKFVAYYVEVNEIHPNSAFKFKQNKLEGMDSVFRFGQTQFFVHLGVLIIRLNIAVLSENPQSIVNKKQSKSRQIQSSLFQDDSEFDKYLQYIVNREDMLKQIFKKN